LDAEHDTSVCVHDEEDARDQLAQEWNQFALADRTSCERGTRAGGGGTYSELITCLEMRQFAGNLHKDDSNARVADR